MAVVVAFEKCNQYSYAKSVEVETDHKPLVSIVKKSLTSGPPRCDFTLKYMTGKELIIADTLFRAYLTDDDVDGDQMNAELECYVHTVTDRVPVSEK